MLWRLFCVFVFGFGIYKGLAGISYEYHSVDEAGVSDALHHRMELAGLDTSYYLLPVVDLNNHLLIHPADQKLVLDAQTQQGGGS